MGALRVVPYLTPRSVAAHTTDMNQSERTHRFTVSVFFATDACPEGKWAQYAKFHTNDEAVAYGRMQNERGFRAMVSDWETKASQLLIPGAE